MAYCRFCGTHGCDDCMEETKAHEYFKLEVVKSKKNKFFKGIYPVIYKEE